MIFFPLMRKCLLLTVGHTHPSYFFINKHKPSVDPQHHPGAGNQERSRIWLQGEKKIDETFFAFKELCLVAHPELFSLMMNQVLTPGSQLPTDITILYHYFRSKSTTHTQPHFCRNKDRSNHGLQSAKL